MALSLAATAAYNSNNFAQAVAHWEHLLKIVPAESEDAKWLTQAVEKTREQMAASGATPAASSASRQATASQATAAAERGHPGRVSLPCTRCQTQPTDTVFVFARNPRFSHTAGRTARQVATCAEFNDEHRDEPEFKMRAASEVSIERALKERQRHPVAAT